MRPASASRRLGAITMTALLAIASAAGPASAQVSEADAPTIETTVVDATTGEPLAGVCLITATATQFRFGEGCSGVSDAAGSVTIEVTPGGTYQLFAWPGPQEDYGAQWVGQHGGTGSQLQAARIEVADGGTAAAPQVRMDPAGTVTGTVTDRDGDPVTAGRVKIGDDLFNVGVRRGWTSIDADGQYDFDVLGPYEWPLKFEVSNHPSQWSGQAVNRHVAETVPVAAGGTTRYDYQLTEGTEVTISEDEAPDAFIALAYSLQTGDRVGAWLLIPQSGVWTIPVLGPQPVKFQLRFGADAGWVGGDDFASATTFVVRRHGEQETILK